MRPSHLTINLSHLAHNIQRIKDFVYPAKVTAVVKANAYGHGLIECARCFEEGGVDFLGVAFIEEGIQLREAGIKMPIIAFGGVSGSQANLFVDYSIDCLASSVSKLEQIEAAAKSRKKKARIHLKIDTGMSRIGIHYQSPLLETLVTRGVNSPYLECVGIGSHLSDSESEDQSFMNEQLNRFTSCIAPYRNIIPKETLLHIANSAAILADKKFHLTMVRPGRILYGVSPAPHLNKVLPLKPVLSLHSEVVYFKVIKKGTQVSYGRTWTATEDTRVVTIPLGYADGISRRMSSNGSVIIRGKRYPVIGTVCMDQFMVNLGPDGEAYNGDTVTIIGSDGSEHISIIEIAENIATEPLEVLTSLNSRLPRKFIYS